MNAVLDARPSLLMRRLARAGVPAGQSAYLASAVSLLETSAARLAVVREGLREHGGSPEDARRILQAAGMLEAEERCARPGCDRLIHARMALCIHKGRGYCSPCCVLDAIEGRAS